MRLILQDELVVAALRDAEAHPDVSVPAPAWTEGLSAEAILQRARVVAGEVVDAATLETIYVDASGFRHAVPGAGRQAVACGWDDPIERDAAGTWVCLSALDRARAARASKVNARRDQLIGGGYQHNFGGTAGIRTLDQRGAEDAINWLGLKGVADAMIAAGNGSDPVEIRDAGDETFTASANVVSGAMVAMGVWRSSVIAHSWTLKDAIAVAADEAAVAAVDIEAGWPGA